MIIRAFTTSRTRYYFSCVFLFFLLTCLAPEKLLILTISNDIIEEFFTSFYDFAESVGNNQEFCGQQEKY